jgi:hypothetical protein
LAFLSIYEFFIPEKDGEHREPSIYKGRDGRRDQRCFLSYSLISTSKRGGPTGKVNLITASLINSYKNNCLSQNTTVVALQSVDPTFFSTHLDIQGSP